MTDSPSKSASANSTSANPATADATSAKRQTVPLHILCDSNPESLQRDLLTRVIAGALVISLTPEANAALPGSQSWPVADVTAERLQAGCPCCVGQVVFRTRLVQWLRKSHPTQVLLLTTDPSHVDTLRAQLADSWLRAAVYVVG
jgi:2-succinyl-5-enolpyruvyl-6-hydroxy-3-cyclohexene-1-carboxylate synthase